MEKDTMPTQLMYKPLPDSLMKIKKEPSVSELLQEGMKKQIEAEEKENDQLNTQNTIGFKDGAER
jgi:AAA15 family ATPase/GTPase